MLCISTICVLIFAVSAQYDDISILGEVLDRTTKAVDVLVVEEGSGVEVSSVTPLNATLPSSSTSTTTTSTTTEIPTTTTTATTTTATTTTTVSTTTTTTEKPTTEAPTQAPTTQTESFPETTNPEEEEEESFLGFKKPDLATIYRRLFPFQHPGQEGASGSFH
ncbi:unnamed protein product [Caenorhabditis bovis]|uniref:Uncharacterized protein n=1 Tax=Caenorhabditis bovis TaxID=2654633 RepID=A0A8S1EPG6_9PELO|nr:unnamed protein product [Caenorhabditis bovis]